MELQDILTEEHWLLRERFQELYANAFGGSSHTLAMAGAKLKENMGKQLRPLILILVASSYGTVTDKVLEGGVAIEMLHTSTLIHDDVVDASLQRRGEPSVNAIFGNKKAVLIGDFLLANAMKRAIDTGSQQVVSRFALLGKELSEGELLQIDGVEMGGVDEEQYFRIINYKTASLLRVTMEVGALLAGEEDMQRVQRLGQAGTKMGLAFQLRDDIFDYQPTPQMGKPAGADIREHKLTLPLIYSLGRGGRDAEKVARVMRHQELSRREVQFVIDFVQSSGGIEYALMRMEQLLAEAEAIIKELLPQNDAQRALLDICRYIGERNK